MKSILITLSLMLVCSMALGLGNDSNPPPTDAAGLYNSQLRNMIDFQSKDGLKISRFAKATWNYAIQGGSSTSKLLLPLFLPANSFITRSYAEVVTPEAGNLCNGCSVITTKLLCGASGSAIFSTNIVGAPAGSFWDGVATGASSVFLNNSSRCQLQMDFGTNGANGSGLTAGKVNFFLEFRVHE